MHLYNIQPLALNGKTFLLTGPVHALRKEFHRDSHSTVVLGGRSAIFTKDLRCRNGTCIHKSATLTLHYLTISLGKYVHDYVVKSNSHSGLKAAAITNDEILNMGGLNMEVQ